MSEHDHQKFVFDVLRLNEAKFPVLKWVYAIPNGGHRHPAVAGKLKAEGVKRGISDICLPFPSRDEIYPGAYIEMKDGKKRPSPEQADFLIFVRQQGYDAICAQSADEALDFIEEYLLIKLRGRNA